MWEKLFEEELKGQRIDFKFNALLFWIIAASGLLSLCAFYFSGTPVSLKILVSLAIFILPASLFCLLLDYLRDKKQRRIENELPVLLAELASFPENAPMEKMVEETSKRDSPLGNEFRKAHNMINAGIPTDRAISEICKRNPSPLLARSLSLLGDSYRNGGDSISCLGKIAQDLQSLRSLKKQSVSALSLQKYTLLAAVGVLIPAILAALVGLCTSLNFDGAIWEFGGGPKNSGLLGVITLAVQIYLFLLCAIASGFIAMQEGKLKKAPVYFCMLLPTSMLLFNLLSGAAII